jgi:hypothetical protein
MTKPVKKSTSGKNIPQKNKKGNTTGQLMQIHLQNKDHVITDEDIENLDLNLSHADSTPPPPELLQPSKDERSEEEIAKAKEDGDRKVTPWDVLGG